MTALPVAGYVKSATSTSSPGPMSSAARTSWSAVVADVVATPLPAPQYAATSCSKRSTRGPCVRCPLASTSAIASSASGPSRGSARRSLLVCGSDDIRHGAHFEGDALHDVVCSSHGLFAIAPAGHDEARSL